MKLLMAVSKEGYVTRARDDDMSWTGPFDKAVFRLLSHVGGELACGSRTFDMIPILRGRNVHRLSRRQVEGQPCKDLVWFHREHPNGWLIGGQLTAINALQMDYVDEAFICVSDRKCFPRQDDENGGDMCLLGTVIHDHRRPYPSWFEMDRVKVGDTTVHVWKRAYGNDFKRRS